MSGFIKKTLHHIYARFSPFFPNSTFLIMKACSKSTAEKKVRFGGWLCGGVAGGFVGASSFGSFLGGFGYFLLVEGDLGWFQVVCCFSSYTNFNDFLKMSKDYHFLPLPSLI